LDAKKTRFFLEVLERFGHFLALKMNLCISQK
jgi:hypothetical protein